MPGRLPAPFVLASSSPYRAALLRRLQLPFTSVAPRVDETPLPDEAPQPLARRLATAKAQVVARQQPDAWVIGSDQVATVNGQRLAKPGNRQRAVEQLRLSSGNTVTFHTAVSLHCHHKGIHVTRVETVQVLFRTLDEAEIAAYLEREDVLDCAGSFKCEGLGISLFESITGPDPTALEGLPLIALARMLRDNGINPLLY